MRGAFRTLSATFLNTDYRTLLKRQPVLPSIGSERKTYFPHRHRFFDPGVCSRSS
jgi:hypothetical protein